MTMAAFKTSNIGLALGPILSIGILFLNLDPSNPSVTYTLAVAILMAVWWITEAVPIAITSLLPVALFPLLGIMNGKAVSSTYFNHVIFLFIGGFMVALAMEKWNLHKRIALKLLMWVGTKPSNILFGFMIATAFLSMWMSNTATTMMMIPIVLSVISGLKIDQSKNSKFQIGLLLGIAYSASIGGIATLVGTPPNLSFTRIFSIIFPMAPEINFVSWFIFALPLTIILFALIFFWLLYLYHPGKNWENPSKEIFRNQYKSLGKASFEEKVIFIVFVSMALLWITHNGIKIGNIDIKGWSSLFPYPNYINDGTIAIFMALILFIVPTKSKKSSRILDSHIISKLPWGIVLLFGGGFALASGFTESGLSTWFGEQLKWVSSYSPLLVVVVISTLMSFLTELTSNTATTEMLLPVLSGLAVSIKVNPLLFMLPATLAASLAFMLPVATPPNAIIFGTNKLHIKDMIKTGFLINIVAVIILSLWVY
ncbi:MAG: DASS family sodium-coupled anion symporter, partial [Bacteroidales bacterium]|nr:DASS family sodium-coupled anion symporter [Bacteroidales bacterium]